MMNFWGEEHNTWMTISESSLLSKCHKRFVDDDNEPILTDVGQLMHEVALQLQYFMYFGYYHNNENIYFMKEGTVHQPELFESVLRGYNIDTTDYEINTEDNIRWLEPTKNN